MSESRKERLTNGRRWWCWGSPLPVWALLSVPPSSSARQQSDCCVVSPSYIQYTTIEAKTLQGAPAPNKLPQRTLWVFWLFGTPGRQRKLFENEAPTMTQFWLSRGQFALRFSAAWWLFFLLACWWTRLLPKFWTFVDRNENKYVEWTSGHYNFIHAFTNYPQSPALL
jgi:hypothetical protein